MCCCWWHQVAGTWVIPYLKHHGLIPLFTISNLRVMVSRGFLEVQIWLDTTLFVVIVANQSLPHHTELQCWVGVHSTNSNNGKVQPYNSMFSAVKELIYSRRDFWVPTISCKFLALPSPSPPSCALKKWTGIPERMVGCASTHHKVVGLRFLYFLTEEFSTLVKWSVTGSVTVSHTYVH